MPDTRPGIEFDREGICSPCKHYENRKNVDWKKRWEELEQLSDKYRNCNGNYYDCIIAASAGKDSYYQTYIFKEVLKMHPLLVSVNSFSMTETGKHNWNNLLEEFGVDAIQLSLNPKVCKKMFKEGVNKGIPTWYFDLAIYTWPLKMALKLNIPLVIYGENINYEYGGFQSEDSPDAKNQLHNDVVKPISKEEWLINGITEKDFAPCEKITEEELNKLNPIYLSYYTPWSGYSNMEFARTRGFRTLDDTREWKRRGFIDQYDQIDTIGYLVHSWFKFPKYGHARVTDVASLWIREGRITREKAMELIKEEEGKLDQKMLKDFLLYINMTEGEFWKIVDKIANRDLVKKENDRWILKK